VEKPRRGAASPVLANVQVDTGDVVRSVQFLKSIRGVTNHEIEKNAVRFSVGNAEISVGDPITMLKAKLHNVIELDQRGRNDRIHVEILRLCVPLFLERQLAAADETEAAARECLRSMQRILELSRSMVACQLGEFDWKDLIPIDRLREIRNRRVKNFREQQLDGGSNRLPLSQRDI